MGSSVFVLLSSLSVTLADIFIDDNGANFNTKALGVCLIFFTKLVNLQTYKSLLLCVYFS